MNTRPSPSSPVRAAVTIASTAGSTRSDVTTASTLILCSSEMFTRCPRYCSVYPFCRPQPTTSVTVRPDTPSASSASCTPCSASGRMIASTFCISAHSFCRNGRLAPRAVDVDGDLARVVFAARDRHEALRVAPHAVLGDVEAVALLLLGHAQAVRLLDQPED